jgi:tight adherence protein B
MKIEILLALIFVLSASGVILTRLRFKRRTQGAISERLARVLPQFSPNLPTSILKRPGWSFNSSELFGSAFSFEFPYMEEFNRLLAEADWEEHALSIVLVSLAFFIGSIAIGILFDFNFFLCATGGAILAAVPLFVAKGQANRRREKFCNQLPDAIDLMVAVLRSGHSVAQAVKAIAQEVPAPTGPEFETVLHRMNLGQPLSEALSYSARRFRSYELDLMRKAVGIQAEVGGSLAELLDKTNVTLRDRLKLARQLKVITAQSRLSAKIVGLLPVVLVLFLNSLTPGYMQLLLSDEMGRMLFVIAIVLEVLGLYIMVRMSTLKI